MKKILNLCVALILFVAVVISFTSCVIENFYIQETPSLSIKSLDKPNWYKLSWNFVYAASDLQPGMPKECSYKIYLGTTDNFSEAQEIEYSGAKVKDVSDLDKKYYVLLKSPLDSEATQKETMTYYFFVEATYPGAESKVCCKEYNVVFSPVPAPIEPKVKKSVSGDFVSYNVSDYKVDSIYCVYDDEYSYTIYMKKDSSSDWVECPSYYVNNLTKSAYDNATFAVVACQYDLNYSKKVQATLLEN